jgi:hypothetical protein
MSLLLEALKKAEKAKEEAQRRARDDGSAAAPATPPDAEPVYLEGAPEPAPEPVITRDQLPDIRQPLALEEEARPAKPAAAPGPERRPEPRTEPRADSQASEREAQRKSARKVFEAKFKEPNPRLPFFITMGALGVFAVGTVVYFWLQLSPPPALVTPIPCAPPARRRSPPRS